MIQNSLKIVKNYVIWYIFRWAGGRVTRGGCVDGWVGGISLLVIPYAQPRPTSTPQGGGHWHSGEDGGGLATLGHVCMGSGRCRARGDCRSLVLNSFFPLNLTIEFPLNLTI